MDLPDTMLEALRDLGWSLFTELGVPGVVRNHQQIMLDPEPIIVVVPALFKIDPRLRDQVYGWCATHAGRLSTTRIHVLARELPEPVHIEFQRFAATLRNYNRVNWPDIDERSWGFSPKVKAHRLPLERPALLRFRARGFCGVGVKADVLCELLARFDDWTRASDLANNGYSKRAIAENLSELTQIGLLRQMPKGNALMFRLSDSGAEHLSDM